MAPSKRILYVDDDPGMARLVARSLSRQGFSVELAANGRDGLSKALLGSFDAIALDHYMPEWTGLDTLVELQARLPDMPPVIFVTGSEDLQVAISVLKAGAADYVIKTTQGEFFVLLQKALEAAIAQAELRRAKQAAEDEARRARETLQFALQAGRLGWWEFDVGSRRLLLSDTCRMSFGPGIVKAMGWAAFRSVLLPEDRGKVRSALRAAFADGADYEIEHRVRCPDGGLRWVYVCGRVSCDAAGKPSRMAGISLDVTGRKEAEEELRRLKEGLEQRVAERTHQLEEANERLCQEIADRLRAEEQLLHVRKLEAIGQLTGGIAHDFNNLLTVILGNLQLATDKETDPAIRRLIETSIRGAERGAKLVTQLLAFGRRQALDVRAVDLNTLIANVRDLVERTVPATINLEFSLDGDLWPALADSAQIELALVNLVLNARDAMPSGGRLLIATRNLRDGAPDVPDELAGGADVVALSVTDTGSGMSDEVKARAFEPFFTTKPVGAGSGLGLSMVYGLVKQLGGTARIDSASGCGTAVTLYLPSAMAASEAAAAMARDKGPEETPSTAGRVLLVDDDFGIREMAAAALQMVGYQVIEAESGAAALAVLDRGETIDILVTDLVMPEMHGSVVAAEALRRRPGLPVLVITGFPGSLPDRGAGEPRFPVLQKPFRPSELAGMVAKCRHQTGTPRAALASRKS
jgi:PAS domain S-box-containing protein